MSEELAPLVLVTGVSGYIAGWIAAGLLHLGYRVRGTVRSLTRKTEHLKDLCPGSRYKLELVEADLLKPDSWPAAVAGCTFIMHTASPFPLDKPKDPEAELYKPARDGTLNVLRAAAEASPRVQRVILTSSMAAVGFGRSDPPGHLYTEADWTNDIERPDVIPYVRSKLMAERAAWDFQRSLPAEKQFELAAVCPATVFGPVLSKYDCSSAEIIAMLLNRKYPYLPRISLPVIDIRAVARAHILAMITPAAAGHRFPLSTHSHFMKDISRILAAEFNTKGFNAPTSELSDWVLKFAAWFDGTAAAAVTQLGAASPVCSHAEVKTILGFTDEDLHTDMREAYVEMGYSLIKHGLVRDRSKGAIPADTPMHGPVDAVRGIPHVSGAAPSSAAATAE